jgi:ribosomal protein S27AE
MKELPIEASVDEFVDAILKETGERVVCSACGNTDWDTHVVTPLMLWASNPRPGVADEHLPIGFNVVTFSCRRCGLVRFHFVDVSFPPDDSESEE